jgi:hypothetical protein
LKGLEDNIKINLSEIECVLDSCGSKQVAVDSFLKTVTSFGSSINGGQYLSNHQLLKKESAQ